MNMVKIFTTAVNLDLLWWAFLRGSVSWESGHQLSSDVVVSNSVVWDSREAEWRPDEAAKVISLSVSGWVPQCASPSDWHFN